MVTPSVNVQQAPKHLILIDSDSDDNQDHHRVTTAATSSLLRSSSTISSLSSTQSDETDEGVEGDGTWKLHRELCARSVSRDWDLSRKEWRVTRIEDREGEEGLTCICGHYPIKEVVHLINTRNHKKVIVGNICIQKIQADSNGSTQKVIAAFKRIKNDELASANRELLDYAYQQGTLSKKEYDFYSDIWRKKVLSQRQEDWKITLNDKILTTFTPQRLQAALTPIRILARNPSGIAALSLIDEAHQQGKISDRDREFYTDIISQRIISPTPKQQQWLEDINRRILNRKRPRES